MPPKLLFISHVLPFPGAAGQELRVRYLVRAAAAKFTVDFLTCAPRNQMDQVRQKLSQEPCQPIVLPTCHGGNPLQTTAQTLAATGFMLRTGLKRSNYRIGRMDLAPARIAAAVTPHVYDGVIYEYFHAVDSVALFRSAGVPAILDMHNVLWKSREQRLNERAAWPAWLKRISLARYRRREESAWAQFDALIAINRTEHDLVQARLRPVQKLFYAPMGTDLSNGSDCWSPATPPRLAYYGGLASAHNAAAALRCHQRIMPAIWQRFPDAELWLVGSNPTDRLRSLTSDPRVKVTGFVDNVQDVLKTMSLVLCPWSGTYGFRSRIVEAMALGVPVVASPAAADGMELEPERGILFGATDAELAHQSLRLLAEPAFALTQSRSARQTVERLYSLESTYGRLFNELSDWLRPRQRAVPQPLTTDH